MTFNAESIRHQMSAFAAIPTPGMASTLRGRIKNADAAVPPALLAEASAMLDARPKRSMAEILAGYGLTLADLQDDSHAVAPAAATEPKVNTAIPVQPPVAQINADAVAAARAFDAARKGRHIPANIQPQN